MSTNELEQALIRLRDAMLPALCDYFVDDDLLGQGRSPTLAEIEAGVQRLAAACGDLRREVDRTEQELAKVQAASSPAANTAVGLVTDAVSQIMAPLDNLLAPLRKRPSPAPSSSWRVLQADREAVVRDLIAELLELRGPPIPGYKQEAINAMAARLYERLCVDVLKTAVDNVRPAESAPLERCKRACQAAAEAYYSGPWRA